ncbi:MAG: alpha/beta hydrolase [Gemmatimonadota bacterium]
MVPLIWSLALAGGTPAPAPPPLRPGTVRSERFFSPALGGWKRYFVYLPPSYDRRPTHRYPVAYYLHGLSGNESDWLSRADIAGVMDSLIAAGAPELILVLPDGDNGWYATWSEPGDSAACAADSTLAEAAATYCVAHQHYDDYVAVDLVTHIDATYRTIADRAHRGIAGLSMGGYGAVTLALRYPAAFAAAASHSGVLSPFYAGPHPFAEPARYLTSPDSLPAVWGGLWPWMAPVFGADTVRWWAGDPAHLVRRLLGMHRPVPALFFDVGTSDSHADENRAFHAELTALGVEHEYAEWPGKHNWPYWHAHVAESLAWLARRLTR